MPKQSKSHKCKSKKKRVKKTQSIMHEKDGTCYLCMLLHSNYAVYSYTEEHHIFFGTSKRRLSEQYGLKVHLCTYHHRGNINGNKEAVHNNNKNNYKENNSNLLLRAAGQRAFERTHTRQEFIEIFQENNLKQEEIA
ncbi:hypothetical protein CG710_016145 [Lachnotalea glycerini]|uniref:Uncharacterized protein n=2 Tax=Lachnotalea glycerini TaxID=1763509 RepID=A0A371JBP0_9FIRM|nr:hypothetical protein CG710_016145 [Lachnotalea glycerini]